MSFRFYLTINDDLTRKLLSRADKEKLDFNQLLIKAAIEYLRDKK